MEKEKKLLIKVLTKIKPYRNLAEGFLVLVEQTQDISFVEELVALIRKEIIAIKDKKKKDLLLRQIENIKKIKNKEIDVSKKNEEDADKILDFLVNNKE